MHNNSDSWFDYGNDALADVEVATIETSNTELNSLEGILIAREQNQ